MSSPVETNHHHQPASIAELLPAELWERILQCLDTFQLSTARLTCRRWHDLVRDSTALLGRFVVQVPERSTLDGESELVRVLARSKNRYASMVLRSVRVLEGNVDWWASLGLGLTTLTLERCWMSIEVLVEMLKGVPNLRELKIACCLEQEFGRAPEIEFRLESLQVLCVDRVELLNALGGSCPRLKLLKLSDSYRPVSEARDDAVVHFVRGEAGRSLEGIKLEHVSAGLLRKLTQIDQLQLRRVSLESGVTDREISEDDLIKFCQRQTAIEHLNVTCLKSLSNEGLHTINGLLPHLRRLKISLSELSTGNLPLAIPASIECLSIASSLSLSHLLLDFTGHTHSNLRKLTLSGVRIPRNTLLQYLVRCANVRTIHFRACFFQNDSQLFSAVHQLRTLHRLHLDGINVDRLMDCLSERNTDSDVRELQLSRCVLRREVLVALSRLFPRLEELRLNAIRHVEVGEILMLWCQGLRRLKRLTFGECGGFTDAVVELVGRFCPRLERLNVWNCHGMTEEVRGRMLMELLGVRVDVKMGSERM